PYIRLGSPTTTSCPSTSNSRDTHGECVPASRTTRHRSRPPKYSRSPARSVTTRPRPTSRPRQSTSHTSLTLSPRSSPTVILGNSSVPPRIADLRLRDPRVRQRSTSLASGILRYAATGRRSAFSSQLRVSLMLRGSDLSPRGRRRISALSPLRNRTRAAISMRHGLRHWLSALARRRVARRLPCPGHVPRGRDHHHADRVVRRLRRVPRRHARHVRLRLSHPGAAPAGWDPGRGARRVLLLLPLPLHRTQGRLSEDAIRPVELEPRGGGGGEDRVDFRGCLFSAARLAGCVSILYILMFLAIIMAAVVSLLFFPCAPAVARCRATPDIVIHARRRHHRSRRAGSARVAGRAGPRAG